MPRVGFLGTVGRSCLLGCLLALRLGAQADSSKERSFIGSVASLVYNSAWPTATYKSWSVDEIKPTSAGVDVIVKLNGLSVFDDSDLWLRLAFVFENGSFKRFRVVDDNHILVAPFTTMTLAATAAAAAAKSATTPASAGPASAPGSASVAAPAPAASPPPRYDVSPFDTVMPTAPRTRASYPVNVNNRCNRTIHVWMRYDDPSHGWTTNGMWVFQAGDHRPLLGENATPIQLADPVVFSYMETADRAAAWAGTTSVTYDGTAYPMLVETLTVVGGSYELARTCSNLPNAPR